MPGSKQQRIDNALKIDNFIKGKQTSNATSASTEKLTQSDCTMFPNPIGTNKEVTIIINKDKLPIKSLDVNVLSALARSYGKHHWDDVQQGILKFDAPKDPGSYIIQVSTGSTSVTLKLAVQ